jgi:hypothetical protein
VGYDLKKGFGALIFIGVGLSLTLATILLNRVMAIIGLDRPIRSAVCLCAVIGPYVNLATYHTWNSPVISHIAGFIASIGSFLISILLDKVLEKSQKPVEQNKA